MSEPQRSATPSEEGSAPAGPEALSDVALKAAEFSDYLATYLRSQKERASFSIRQALKGVVLFFLLGLLGAGVLFTGVVFVFYGLAEGLALWLGGREWLAYFLAGILPILATTLWLRFGLFGPKKRALKKQLKAYEEELRQQRAHYGHDAVERATEWASR